VEVSTTFIIRAIALVVEVVRTSETSVYSNEIIHDAVPQKAAIFILAAVRT
jgi:hypothetical protein